MRAPIASAASTSGWLLVASVALLLVSLTTFVHAHLSQRQTLEETLAERSLAGLERAEAAGRVELVELAWPIAQTRRVHLALLPHPETRADLAWLMEGEALASLEALALAWRVVDARGTTTATGVGPTSVAAGPGPGRQRAFAPLDVALTERGQRLIVDLVVDPSRAAPDPAQLARLATLRAQVVVVSVRPVGWRLWLPAGGVVVALMMLLLASPVAAREGPRPGSRRLELALGLVVLTVMSAVVAALSARPLAVSVSAQMFLGAGLTIVLLGVPPFVLAARRGSVAEELAITRPRPAWSAAAAAGLGLGLGLGCVALIRSAQAPFEGHAQSLMLAEHRHVLAPALLAMTMTAAFVEEVFFRGLLMGALLEGEAGEEEGRGGEAGEGAQRRRRVWAVALLVSTALFVVAHAARPQGMLGAWWLLTTLGLLTGALRLWSGSILPAITAHLCYNLVAVAAVLL